MPVRRVAREVRTCSRCRLLKLRCDRLKPSCQRCTRANVTCSLGACSPTDEPSTGLLDLATEALPRSDAEASLPSIPESGVVKQRQRAQLSCIRCHRLKVRCDRDLPCSRCRMSGWGKFCEYRYRVETASPSLDADAPKIGPDLDGRIKSWHAQRRGATHWGGLLSALKLQAGRVDLPVRRMISDLIHQQNANISDEFVLPENFPFNSPAAANFASLDSVHDLLQQHRPKYQFYMNGYLALYQPSFPIIDTAMFSSLAEKFWNDPRSTDVAWLASFLMVLALGCFAVTRDQHATMDLCMAAEACLSKTPFMVQPDISAVRTLCLMVLAKQTLNATCRTFDSCWTLLGTVIRAATAIDLHKQRMPHHGYEDIGVWQFEQTMWSTVVYFCVQVAMVTGKPLIVSADMFAERIPLSISQTNDPWVMLIDVYPTLCHIISRITSNTDKPLYDEVVKYNDHVRRLMDTLLGKMYGKPRLYITLDIFFRRILLVLHRSHALHAVAPSEYPVSYWSSLECSLAILVHYRDLEDQKELDNTDLLSRLFKSDIFASMLTVCLYLLRQEAPLSAGSTIPPRRIILNTLQACMVIWEKEVHHSTCFKIGLMLLDSVLKFLPDL
ncbi:hypothetical protein M441DRAFT_450759 [Trichoderma asperellum CBS 433.97]|uniref:Zn(2)-C6 fungal-type domain-containing protein n=1 Tax=Trichoderma asperellum (strain ATCC 204424 / CBS 433.97 / NBRC 101777) TaxID=1042311 RepID=A0A2T3ZJ53_TRIA4|nr:hypothetical protein M441DRAFT_450759 [Trichoderma asperellum CBS 433.97]PTB44841.1 hypothetical protein M441DRAFT_450759 [Trichoderma asperellum CBS 433.97]